MATNDQQIIIPESVNSSEFAGESSGFQQQQQYLLLTIAEKDAIISQLNQKICDLERALGTQSNQIGELNQNIKLLLVGSGIATGQTSNANGIPPKRVAASSIGSAKRIKRQSKTKKHQLDHQLESHNLSSDEHVSDDEHNNAMIFDPNDVPNSSESGDEFNNVVSTKSTKPTVLPPVNVTTPTTSYAAAVGKKTTKIMPIQLQQLNQSDAQAIFGALNERFADQFEWFQPGVNTSPKIFAKDIQIKQSISEFLRLGDYQFSTFSEPGQQNSAFVIRGLNFGSDIANIAAIGVAFRDANIESKLEISRYITGTMRKAENASQLYRVVVSDANLNAIKTINKINGIRVVIEKMKKSSVVQCKNCQRFQHTARSCSYNYRCVQCDIIHQPGCRPRKSNAKLPIKCVNCVVGGFKNCSHTANDLVKCEFFKTRYPKLNQKFVKSRQDNIDKHNANVNVASTAAGNTLSKSSNSSTLRQHNDVPVITGAKTAKTKKSTVNRMIKKYRPSINNQPKSVSKRQPKNGNSSKNSKPSTVFTGKSFDASVLNDIIGAFSTAFAESIRGVFNVS